MRSIRTAGPATALTHRTPPKETTPAVSALWDHSGFISHFCDTSLNPLFIWGLSLWEALFVVSQKWIPFPTALRSFDLGSAWCVFGVPGRPTAGGLGSSWGPNNRRAMF